MHASMEDSSRNRAGLCQALLAACVFLLTGCSTSVQVDNQASELVMQPGMSITATNSQGTMRIDYIDQYTRRYAWDGNVKTFRHQPRMKRWLGSLGMYCPQGDGSMHAVLDEGQMPFITLGEAHAWLRKAERFMDLVWTDDGLVVGWKTQARPDDGYLALHVQVWQILVGGKKPCLKGAEPANIQLSADHPG
jgi:hypothetical protein